jgi:hypothetical protein
MTFSDAQKLIERCGDDLTNVYRVPDRAPAGTVISQDPVNPGGRLVVSTGPLRHRWAVLAGAKNPPVRSECAAPLRLDADGNAGPLTCGNDQVNVEAWDYFALNHFPVMSLPRGSSECRVVGTITKDYVSVPINDSAFQLANVYNGWRIPEGLAAHVLVSTPYNDPC